MATTNTLGVYNPIFYAQEALIQLEKALGMAGRVYRGFDEERRTFGKGQTISIRKPSIFTAASAPATAANIVTETVDITLDQWYEVKFSLTDKELAYTGQRVIDDHIRPAAYALADNIDTALAALYKYVPWYYDLSGTPVVADVTGPHQVLFDNGVPVYDEANLHFMMDGTLSHSLMGLSAFSQWQGAGAAGVETQQRGTLGRKYGFECFANQNTPSHTAGACADTAGAILAGGFAKGATTITIDDLTDTQTVKAGDSFVIAGNTQRYVFTENKTVSSNALTSIGIYPALVAAATAEAVVTIRADSHKANLAFHRNAFALAMAPLSEIGNELGAKIATITDPKTGLSIRSRMYYMGDVSEVHVALDVLYGVKILDGNLACRACGA
jgi:hypothetical protein